MRQGETNKLFKMAGSSMSSSKTTDNRLVVESGGAKWYGGITTCRTQQIYENGLKLL